MTSVNYNWGQSQSVIDPSHDDVRLQNQLGVLCGRIQGSHVAIRAVAPVRISGLINAQNQVHGGGNNSVSLN